MKPWKPVTRIGVYYQDDDDPRSVGGLVRARDGTIHFQYDGEWLASGLELSPRLLPLSIGMEVIPAPDPRKLHGLHGVFADALPDTWGMRVLSLALRRHGWDPARVGSLDRLAFLGTRTMGALTFRPAVELDDANENEGAATLDLLASQAEKIFEGTSGPEAPGALDILERAAGTAGGGQPKILLSAGDHDDRDIAVGEASSAGHRSYLLKFTPRQDGLGHRTDSGVLEEAYARMARAAGIDVPPTRLFGTSDGRKHFAVERFDRTTTRGRRHIHTLGGLLGREAGDDGDYDELMRVAFALTADARARDEVLRRLCFNLAVLNDDDHLKNTAFVMEPGGGWSLSPAYDLTYSPSRYGERGMAVDGHEADVHWSTVATLAERHSVRAARLNEIRDEVQQAVAGWVRHAAAAGASQATATEVARRLDERRHALDA